MKIPSPSPLVIASLFIRLRRNETKHNYDAFKNSARVPADYRLWCSEPDCAAFSRARAGLHSLTETVPTTYTDISTALASALNVSVEVLCGSRGTSGGCMHEPTPGTECCSQTLELSDFLRPDTGDTGCRASTPKVAQLTRPRATTARRTQAQRRRLLDAPAPLPVARDHRRLAGQAAGGPMDHAGAPRRLHVRLGRRGLQRVPPPTHRPAAAAVGRLPALARLGCDGAPPRGVPQCAAADQLLGVQA